MKMKDLYADERPREKMIDKGVRSLSHAELLAILLRTGTGKMNAVEVGHELLKSAEGKLNGIAAMSLEALCRIEGIGPGKATAITAAFELGRRTASEHIIPEKVPISSPRAVFRTMMPLLRGLDHEECWVLFLNRANYILGKEKMSSGGFSATIVDTKAILHRAIEKKAAGIILIHNHPSGNARPGQADIRQTDILRKALATCEIQMIDHVIIAEDNYYSFADEKLMSEKF